MTFNEFIKQHNCTYDEIVRLAAFLIALRLVREEKIFIDVKFGK